MTVSTFASTSSINKRRSEIANARIEGALTGRTEERARISTILGSEEATGRKDQANFIAFETDMSVDRAKVMLAKSAKAGAPAAGGGNSFADAMDRTGNPNIRSDVGDVCGDDGASADPVVALVRAAGMRGFGASASH